MWLAEQVAPMVWSTNLAVLVSVFQAKDADGESLVCHLRGPLDVAMAQCVQEPSGCSYGSLHAAETYGTSRLCISTTVGSMCNRLTL